jgi:predicted nucleic acid-binding Zn ribbon protein
MRNMEHIAEALERFLKARQLDRRVAEYELVAAWPGAVGQELAAHAEARELRRGVLWVAVSGSAWTQHIQFLKPRILEALRQRVPGVAVHDIRCLMRGRRASEQGHG